MIARAGRPIARLVPVSAPTDRVLGRDRGAFEVPEDFDDPLPADVLVRFLG
jgi:antitoxin (DNA-binding transcriptional repressor) of toxin-antitoxin stability system